MTHKSITVHFQTHTFTGEKNAIPPHIKCSECHRKPEKVMRTREEHAKNCSNRQLLELKIKAQRYEETVLPTASPFYRHWSIIVGYFTAACQSLHSIACVLTSTHTAPGCKSSPNIILQHIWPSHHFLFCFNHLSNIALGG